MSRLQRAYTDPTNSRVSIYNNGRYLLVILLFVVALYTMKSSGLPGFAVVFGGIPILVTAIYLMLNNRMAVFWFLFVFNFFLMGLNRYVSFPVPLSLPNEAIEIILILLAIIDAKDMQFKRLANMMGLMIGVWCSFICLEILNNTVDYGDVVGPWFTGARLMAFKMMYDFIIFSIYVNTPEKLKKLLFLWGVLSIISAYWAWQQKYIGFTGPEEHWFNTVGYRTHRVNGIVRYFSLFNDSATYGISAASSALVFWAAGITSYLRRDKIFFLTAGAITTYGMMLSGTRTAMACLIFGFIVYLVLSKSVKIISYAGVVFVLLVIFLAGTNIGNGDPTIRRMRSTFNKNDASANARTINQQSMKKYLVEAPFGIGVGRSIENIPPNNKYRTLAGIPPDSEYVFIWVHTGYVGISVFLVITAIMFLSACCVAFFTIDNPRLRGIAGGICAAFASVQLGGYGNQVLFQFPNGMLFYGALAIVFNLKEMEPAWEELEQKLYQEEQLKLQQKREKKAASRV